MIEQRLFDELSQCCIDFVDDGRVAYAYFLDPDEKIVGDVWLYNRCETRIEPEWSRPENLPFANSAAFAKDHSAFRPVEDISEVSVCWEVMDDKTVRASILIRCEVFAMVMEGAKPGWSKMAEKDGQLAKVLGTG